MRRGDYVEYGFVIDTRKGCRMSMVRQPFLVPVRGIGLGFVGEAQEIVGAGMVEFRELDQDFGGDIPRAELVIGVRRLRASKVNGKVFLPQVFVFAKCADSLKLHGVAFLPLVFDGSISKTICYIDFYYKMS